MIRRARVLWRRLGASFATVPLLMVFAAVLAAAVTNAVDARWDPAGTNLPPWLRRGEADDIRALLGVISGALITVLAVVVSVTMVVLQLASSQLGPRLLRRFLANPVARATFGLYLAVFVYSLLVLLSLRTPADPAPHLGATVAVFLAIVAAVALIGYVTDTARSIQVGAVVNDIVGDLGRTIEERRAHLDAATGLRPPQEVLGEVTVLKDRLASGDGTVTAWRVGYLQVVRHAPLVTHAAARDYAVLLRVRPGDFVGPGQVVAQVWPPDRAAAAGEELRRSLVVGPYRTLAQDVGFAVDQLVEIAIRALSPAINDTFTGLTCIDWLGAALVRLAGLPLERVAHVDTLGRLRVADRSLPFTELVGAAFDKIRTAGATNPAVATRLLATVAAVAPALATPDQRAALAQQADMVREAAAAAGLPTRDRVAVEDAYAGARRALGTPAAAGEHYDDL